MVNVKDKYVYTVKGNYELTPEDIERLRRNNTPIGVVQTRVDSGWNIKDAIRLHQRYIKKDGMYKALIKGGGKHAYLSEQTIEEAYEQGLTFEKLDTRIKQGVKLLKPYKANDLGDEKVNSLLKKDIERKRKAENRKKEREQAKRPWLYDGTPQEHERSLYVCKQMKYDVFPKVKSDSFGNAQLG